jgi:hypothetical protein
MLVWVELTGRRIRQSPRAAHRLVESGVGCITDPDSKAVYDTWLKGQKPASTVTAPEKPKVTKRTRSKNDANT